MFSRTHRKGPRQLLVHSGVALALVAGVAACGDDDDDAGGATTTAVATTAAEATTTDAATTTEGPTTTVDDSTTTSAGDTTTSTAAGGGGDFCRQYGELLAGEPGPDEIRALADSAPDAAQDALETLASGFESGGEEFFASEEFTTAFGTLAEAAADECADERFDAVALDYSFEDIPDELSAGTYGIALQNDGLEFHELLIFRRNDDASSQSFDDILGMDEGEAEALLTMRGVTFAAPGASATGLYDLTEPGDYIAICFIPVGSTPEAMATASGPPHFTVGMTHEFTVTD